MADPLFDLAHPEPHELLVEHRSHAFLPSPLASGSVTDSLLSPVTTRISVLV